MIEENHTVITMLIELLFMADISLNLRMGYRDSASARLVMNRKQIRAHYLRTRDRSTPRRRAAWW